MTKKKLSLPRITAVLLSLLVVCHAQQTGVSSRKIILRLLNGKTGKPIRRHDVTNIWLGDAKTFSLQEPDSRGEIIVDVTNVQPFEIRVHLGNYVDCRLKDIRPVVGR